LVCGNYGRFVQDENGDPLLARLYSVSKGSTGRFVAFDTRRQMYWGWETRGPADHYDFSGSRRGISEPPMLFQYTLGGRGAYTEGGKVWAMEPGSSLTVLFPSVHRYYLPKGSSHWTFFWFMVQHPFVNERIRLLRQLEPAVQRWGPGSAALEAAVALFEAACCGRLVEVWTFEGLLVNWLLETERELYHRRYPVDERQRLLDETRQFVRDRLQKPPDVPELAALHRLERTTFSRKFKVTTGLSPAAFITEVRLEEALKLLCTDAKIEDIAADIGFADANHFCKVFRRRFHSSPGAYRRLVLNR